MVVVLAGLGSIFGAFAAGLVLGIAEQVSVFILGAAYREVAGSCCSCWSWCSAAGAVRQPGALTDGDAAAVDVERAVVGPVRASAG